MNALTYMERGNFAILDKPKPVILDNRDAIVRVTLAVIQHKEEFSGYKVTPKGMLQIFVNQQIPTEVLMRIFAETLEVTNPELPSKASKK